MQVTSCYTKAVPGWISFAIKRGANSSSHLGPLNYISFVMLLASTSLTIKYSIKMNVSSRQKSTHGHDGQAPAKRLMLVLLSLHLVIGNS